MGRYKHSMFFPANVLGEMVWHPAADIYRAPCGWLLKFDLAGVNPEDVAIAVQGAGSLYEASGATKFSSRVVRTTAWRSPTASSSAAWICPATWKTHTGIFSLGMGCFYSACIAPREVSNDNEKTVALPLLPLKNTLLFPYLMTPLSVGRPASLAAVEAALATEQKEIFVVAQRDPNDEAPGQDELYTIGTKAIVRKMARPNEEMMELLVLGTERVVIQRVEQTEPYMTARYAPLPLPEDGGPEVEALERSLLELATKAIALAQPQAPPEISRLLTNAEDPMRLVFMLASMFSLDIDKEQALLESQTRLDALRLMHTYLSHEIQVLELRTKIAS